MSHLKTIKSIFYILIFLGSTISHAQYFSTLEKEKSEPFSYFNIVVDQIGFKNSPEAMASTDGGTLSSTFMAAEFLFGKKLEVAKNRVISLQDGHLPIFNIELKDGNVVYKMEAFSAPIDLNPKNNLVTYVKWTVSNNSDKKETAKLGVNLQSLYAHFFPGNTTFLQHNRYVTPWFKDKYVDADTFDENHTNFNFKDGEVTQGGHTMLLYPNSNEKFDNKSNQISTSFKLAGGESKELIFKLPYVPMSPSHTADVDKIKATQYSQIKNEVVQFWKKELAPLDMLSVSEKKVMDVYKYSFVNLLIARDNLEKGDGFIQKCNEFQYDHFYVRDNAYFARMYAMLGLEEDSKTTLQPYFIYDIEGKPIHFRQRTGVYNKLCHDYWGQVLWAFGSYFRQYEDPEMLEKTYGLLKNHIKDFDWFVASDDRGLWPATWPYDNEDIDGHYTGHSFWVILGLRDAIFMAEKMGNERDIKKWTRLYNTYKTNFEKELKEITDKTDGYIPPGMDEPEDGFDWANASAGLYPFEAIDKNNPIVKKTLETVRNYNFMEGISTYQGSNAFVAKKHILSNQPIPGKERRLHHYETFYVTTGNLIIGEQKKVIEDLYGVLAHTSNTQGGFEWEPTPWADRDFKGRNRTPHGWMGARFIELFRNMLVREEGKDIHLFSAVSPNWVKAGEDIVVNDADTYMGKVSYKATFDKNSMKVTLNNKFRDNLNKVFFHIPWFIKATSITVDGVAKDKNASELEISKNTKEISISWENEIESNLSYDNAVDYFLDKYYNKPETANYVTLFPTMAAPRVSKQNDNTIYLFAPDNIGKVYYTTDGTLPTEQSKLYNNNGVSIKGISALKAIVIDENGTKSDCLTLDLSK